MTLHSRRDWDLTGGLGIAHGFRAKSVGCLVSGIGPSDRVLPCQKKRPSPFRQLVPISDRLSLSTKDSGDQRYSELNTYLQFSTFPWALKYAVRQPPYPPLERGLLDALVASPELSP